MSEKSVMTPEEIRSKEFSLTLRRGYERREVDAFVMEMAQVVQALMDHSPWEPSVEQGEELLKQAAEAASLIEAQARESSARERRRATARAKLVRQKAKADATAEFEAAREHATQILTEARSEAARVRSETEAEHRMRLAEATEPTGGRLLETDAGVLHNELEMLERAVAGLRTSLGLGRASPNGAIHLDDHSSPRIRS